MNTPLFKIHTWFLVPFLISIGQVISAETHFFEAEAFSTESDGWRINQNAQTRGASAITALNGATGDPKATASAKFIINQASEYRIWVRHNYNTSRRGPFRLSLSHGDRILGEKVFDLDARPDTKDWSYVWDSFDASLLPGSHQLTLTKHQEKNCTGYVRNVDCVLITSDLEAEPDHSPYGPQTWLRVSLSDIYERPLHVHIFADHYRAPWYGHWHLSRAGAQKGLRPDTKDLLESGEQTPWCNITPMLYQDSGAILNISARYTYAERAERLKAKFEFATSPEASAIVRTFDVDSEPGGLVIVAPPDLRTRENLDRFKRDREFAEATGKIADAYEWPTFGKKPEKIPFYVSATVGGYGTDVDQEIADREWKTLAYFGFSNRDKPFIHGGIWRKLNNSYCQPDLEAMRKNAKVHAHEFLESGKKAEDIAYCMLTDEPTGQPSTFLVSDPAYHDAFRAWLKKLGKAPGDLLVDSWNEVKPVLESERDRYPGLHYFTQRFRTRALGDFMATQRTILEEAYGASLPTLVNFSDGATYQANFYGQGVDYFELLDDDNHNAIWSEDWANGSSSYQCGAYNVALMQAAARDRGQAIGHYLVAHANRKPWDIQLKCASETARGVRLWKNFSYGVSWGSHEGGPAWRSHTWYNHPEKWWACAAVVREIGGAEDLLVDAKPAPAEVAILYSSSSDAWTTKRNHASGFNRMHTWMALAHAQVPVDFVAERQVERGDLDRYKVCYFSGPNLTQEAATKLADWVENGGTLVLSAGAAARDEFNRPLDTIETLLPASRFPVEEHQAYLNSGSYMPILKPFGTVQAGDTELEILSLSQSLEAKPGSEVHATTSNGKPMIVEGATGKGRIHTLGFLPALSYIKEALVARRALAESQEAAPEEQGDNPTPTLNLANPVTVASAGRKESRLERSYNPWEFSASVRDLILEPVQSAKIEVPLECDTPLVDAVVLESEKGIVIPLANYTLESLPQVSFRLHEVRPVKSVESVRQGILDFRTGPNGSIHFSLPLDASDYVKLYFQ